MNIIKAFFGFFSPYVNSFERRVDRFFRNIKSTDNFSKIQADLFSMMRENLIVTNVWLEKKFKGYKYLSKKMRRQMYSDVEAIKRKLEEFSASRPVSVENIRLELKTAGLDFPNGDEAKIKYLFEIMQFLRPGRYYRYIKTASFGKLLRNPNTDVLEGDCNQIVTLYIYLYSLKYPVEDLKIKLLPEHVCLHFRNIDIEATNGTFQRYRDNLEVLPVTEIVSTNLLDLTDFREEVQSVSPEVMVKSAQLAYAISSLKSLVQRNLEIAYHNLAISAMSVNNFKSAIFYLSKSGDKEMLKTAYHNAAVYYLKSENFKKARYFAGQSGDSSLEKTVKYHEGVFFYRKSLFDDALRVFEDVGDQEMKKAVYAKKYNLLLKKVSGVKTLADAKRLKSTYQNMLSLAQKMGDSSLERGIRDTLSKI